MSGGEKGVNRGRVYRWVKSGNLFAFFYHSASSLLSKVCQFNVTCFFSFPGCLG